MLNKDRVTELVVQSGLHEFGGHDRERFLTALAYFATAIQHEALIAAKREDAEPVANEVQLNIIRYWPDGFADRLEHVWKDLIGFVPNYKLYDLKRVLAEFGFTMQIYEGAAPIKTHPSPAVVRQLVEALEHHQEQTRPIQRTIEALAAAKEAGL